MDEIIDQDVFYGEIKGRGFQLRGILWPLDCLSPRERAVFTEYHYWRTHMKVIAESHRISLGRAYEILYRAEDKIASSRPPKKEENPKNNRKGLHDGLALVGIQGL